MTQDGGRQGLARPSGFAPPTEAALGPDAMLSLVPLAEEVCRRYRTQFPDEEQRYGDAGNAWCVHDNQHLLNWGCGAVQGLIDMNPEVAWLADVLAAREFPVERLASNLDIAAQVVLEYVPGDHGRHLFTILTDAAEFIRFRPPGEPASS